MRPSYVMLEIGQRLAALRRERGLTQMDVAEVLGFRQPSYSYRERTGLVLVSEIPAFARAFRMASLDFVLALLNGQA